MAYTKNKWTKEIIIKKYKRLSSRLARIPTTKDLRENGHREMEYAIYREFKKLTNLRIAANICGDRHPPKYWTIQRIKKELRNFCNENEQILSRYSLGSLLLGRGKRKLYNAIMEKGGLQKLNADFNLGLRFSRNDWTENAIIRELKRLHSSGYKITEKSLKKLHQRGLYAAITSFSSLNNFKEKIGIPVTKRTRWTKEKIIQEYHLLCRERKRPPTIEELKEIGKSALSAAIIKKFGSICLFRELISVPSFRKPRNYWTKKNTLKELQYFIRMNPDFDGDVAKKLREIGRHDVVGALYKHGGLGKLNKEFKLNLNLLRTSWTKAEILRELQALNQRGVILTQKKLISLGRNDLLGAVSKFGGLNVFKNKLRLPVKRHNYWSTDRILAELKPIAKAYGRIPSEPVFKYLGKYDVLRALKKRGGMKVFANLLNTASTGYYRANDGHYMQSGYECVFDNILYKYNIPHEVHGKILPDQAFRYDFLIDKKVYIEICGYNKIEHTKYHERLKRKSKLYRQLGLNVIIVNKDTFKGKIEEVEKSVLNILNSISCSRGSLSAIKSRDHPIMPAVYWADIKIIKKELLPLIKKYGRVPLDRELRKEGKASLVHGVYKYHGSFYEVAKKLGLKILYKPKKFYNMNSAVEEYKQLCLKYERFLTQKELQKMNYYGLLGFIAKNGGICVFRIQSGLTYKSKQLPRGYYTMEKAKQEYQQLCFDNNRLISSRELTKLGKGPLAAFVQKNGGYLKIRKEIGLQFPTLRKPKNFWTKPRTRAEYIEFTKALKRSPLEKDFQELKRQDLRGAIAKHGGLSKANQKWGQF